VGSGSLSARTQIGRDSCPDQGWLLAGACRQPRLPSPMSGSVLFTNLLTNRFTRVGVCGRSCTVPTLGSRRASSPAVDGMEAVVPRTPGVPPTRTDTDSAPRHAPTSKRRSSLFARVSGLRNEKVRGSSPLSSTTYKRALTRGNAQCGWLYDLH
jgi:hypothetical protein